MRLISLLLLSLLISPAPSRAVGDASTSTQNSSPKKSAAKKRPQTRTLADLIKLTMTEGRDKDIDPVSAANLGFENTQLHTKLIRYKDTASGEQHAFHVVYKGSASDGMKETDMVWYFTKLTEKDSVRYVQGKILRVSLDGVLKKAITGEGKVGKVRQTQLAPDSPEAKGVFKSELDFYLRKSLSLNMSK